MPSRVFAASTYQVSEPSTLCPHSDKEYFVRSAPTGTDNEDMTEPALDFQGHKHVDTSVDGDQVYTLQDDESSSYTLFTMPGQATANALRDYLSKHLQAHQIVDEYGNECEMYNISNDHLAVLQAKIWTKVSNSRSPTKATAPRPSRAQVLVAGHIAKISQLLEEKHIFKLNETEHGTCDYSNGLQESTKHICKSQSVRLEPLIHWGTITPATASEAMAIFRRDGDLMQEPAYKQLVRRSIDPEAATYCVDCLGYLWGKRAEAREITKQLVSVAPHNVHGSSRAHQADSQQIFEEPDYIVGSIALTVGGTITPTAYQSEPAKTEVHVEASMASRIARSSTKQDGLTGFQASFQLDGTSDCPITTKPCHARNDNDRVHGAVWVLPDTDGYTDKQCEDVNASSRSDALTLPLRTSSMPRGSNGFPLSTRHATKALDSTTNQVEKTTKGGLTKNKYCSRQTTPPHTTDRKFGRELDTNSTVFPVQARRSPRKHTEKASMSLENLPLVPIRPMKPLKQLKQTKDATKETKKRKNDAADHRSGKQKKARITGPKETKPKPNVRFNSTAGRRTSLEPECAVLPCSPPKLTVYLAKQPVNPEIPEGVDVLTYEAFQNMHPSPTFKMCFCSRPASHGNFRKGERARIARCINRDCPFGWYHYACLNASDKGKARWGKLLCQHCRNEEHFGEQDQKNGWSMAQQMDFRTEWTREDMEVEMPGLGGHAPVARPYGLGCEIQLGPAYYQTKAQTKGALGGLSGFGLAQSHPHMLVEAYTNSDAYAGLRAALAENEADGGEVWVESCTADDYGDEQDEPDAAMDQRL